MLAAVGLGGVGVGVLLLWSAVANVSPVDVLRSVFDPSITPGAIDATPPRSTAASSPAASTSSGPALTDVQGITVSTSIAGPLGQLLLDAERSGIRGLSGSGYRSTARQIELRRQNCGPTDDDIFHKPAGQCSPPTAPPGRSMHEQGLAVDFTQNGRSLTRTSSAFRWLAANAGRYGFRNLPSEPWHWSTTGQ